MFAIEIQQEFCASHQLRLPDGTLEPLHGHNFRVTVQVQCHTLDAMETVMDFHVLETCLKKVLAPWVNQHFNEIEPFKSRVNPSAERIAEEIGRLLMEELNTLDDFRNNARGLLLTEIRITEAPNALAVWRIKN